MARGLRCIRARTNATADVWLRTRANHFSSHAKVLTSPRRRTVWEEIAERGESFFEFFSLLSFSFARAPHARSGFSFFETETPLLSCPLFPTRKRSLRRFVSEGEAVVTNFTPPPSTLILVRENTIRGSAGLTENFLPANPPRKSTRCFSHFLMKLFFFFKSKHMLQNTSVSHCLDLIYILKYQFGFIYNSKNVCN